MVVNTQNWCSFLKNLEIISINLFAMKTNVYVNYTEYIYDFKLL